MSIVGLRELRQDASDLVKRVEAGEEINITVAGRLTARLVPAKPRTWRTFDEIEELFSGSADPEWQTDRDAIDHGIRDPWSDR